VAAGGSDAIHESEVAEAIEDEVAKGGGVLTHEDLADYEPKVSEPLAVSYRDYAVATVPTPSGGVTVLKSLNILENFELSSMGHNSLEYLSVFIEGVRNAFADRYRFLGDWEQADVPLRGLLSKDYARELAGQIDPGRTAFLQPENVEPWTFYLERAIHDPWRFDTKERPCAAPGFMASSSFGGTTHFNAVDEDRNVVSCTHTPGGPTGGRPNGQGDRPTESRRRVEAAELRHPEVCEGAADKERTPRHHFEHDEVMIEDIGGPRSRSMGTFPGSGTKSTRSTAWTSSSWSWARRLRN